jgi:hypothetical protein
MVCGLDASAVRQTPGKQLIGRPLIEPKTMLCNRRDESVGVRRRLQELIGVFPRLSRTNS